MHFLRASTILRFLLHRNGWDININEFTDSREFFFFLHFDFKWYFFLTIFNYCQVILIFNILFAFTKMEFGCILLSQAGFIYLFSLYLRRLTMMDDLNESMKLPIHFERPQKITRQLRVNLFIFIIFLFFFCWDYSSFWWTHCVLCMPMMFCYSLFR